jgi:UDP-N-acetyl-2-amino-2-deoxyglucuronate dehydrogenase
MNTQLPVTFALLGCGNIGHIHANLIQQVGLLKAVCDVDAKKAHEFANKYQCQSFTSITQLLENKDLAQVFVICTPNGLHAQQAIQALNAGMHVLVEKPMALTVADCQQMINAAHINKKVLMVVKQNRFNPPVIAVKKLINNQALGKIYSIQLNCLWHRNANYYKESNWRGSMELDGGVLFTQFSHFIDVLLWLVQCEPTAIQAFAANMAHQSITEFEDTGIVTVQFSNGTLAGIHFSTNAYGRNAEGSILINAEKGIVKIGGTYLNEITYQNLSEGDLLVPETINSANQYNGYQGSMRNHDKVYENFLQLLQHQSNPFITNEEALNTVDFIEKIHKAIRVSNTLA